LGLRELDLWRLSLRGPDGTQRQQYGDAGSTCAGAAGRA